MLAKDLVNTRNACKKNFQMQLQMKSISNALRIHKSTMVMTEVMKKTTGALMKMNGAINLEQLRKILTEYDKQGTGKKK